MPLITLTTDFGTADHYVAAMKGVILTTNPQAQIVDVTHEIPPQDIEAGAFTLLAACSSFPSGTIHVGVVDPGVGSARRPILIEAGDQFFVGPDNGLFSYVCERLGVKQAIVLTNSKYFRQPVSQTFNGRDIFAPVASALSMRVKPARFGSETAELVRLPSLEPVVSVRGTVAGRVIHIDGFGNCITNLTSAQVTPDLIKAGATVRLKGTTIHHFKNYFSELGTRDKVFAMFGSTGFLEVAAANQSAAKLLKVKRNDVVRVTVKPSTN